MRMIGLRSTRYSFSRDAKEKGCLLNTTFGRHQPSGAFRFRANYGTKDTLARGGTTLPFLATNTIQIVEKS